MGDQYRELSALVGRVRRRWRAVTALRAWSLAAAGAALVLALALVADALIGPQGPVLMALWAVAALASLASLAWIVRPARHAPDDLRVARLVEEWCPELEDSLVTAIAERDTAAEGVMTAAVVGDAVSRIRALDIDRIVSGRMLRLAGLRAAGAAVALCALAWLAAGPAGRAAAVASLYLFPHRFVFDVVPGDVRLQAGTPLRIVARIEGLAGVTPRLRMAVGDQWRDAPMEAGADGFTLGFARVDDSFRYAVAAGGSSSREYSVTVIRPPQVERIDLRYEYPRAFDMPPRDEQDGGDIYGPAGTRVRLTVFADKPIAEAALTLSGGRPVRLTPHGDVLEGDLTIVADGSYRVALTDADGLSTPGDTEYFIRTLQDRPPDVRIVRPAADRQVTPIEEVPIEARADDDFGVASLELVYAVRGGREVVVPFDRRGSGTAVTGRQIIYVEDLRVEPGDFVTYYARARDVSRGKPSSEARSDIFFLEVTPFDEEFVSVQGQSGGADDPAAAEMIEAQKQIITATWKLDRRGRDAGGRSPDDIRTVAAAQRELRARAVTARTQMQRIADLRRRQTGGRGRQNASADPAADAVRRAVEAMSRAAQRLDALDTTGALPHEMAALNELLRAQAENRRREIGQQQASGRGGQNRQQQDLSSLFDRELARQQQTMFETPNSRETRADDARDSEAADRLRELARRQDELTRQLQEMAQAARSPQQEELRRQLERLTREQSELRRQAEELARQLQQEQARQGAQSGRGGQSGAAARELQQISEDMQGAASELRRANPQEASQRGARAAERLRDLEQRLRGSQPDDRRRALGELQLESRQIADGQRRLSTQSGPESDAADAARRRAAEQARLADRAGRVEQAVQQLADAPGGDPRERAALGEAAREIDRQRPSEQMRNAAGQQRAATGREGEEIARALDRLADRLGAAIGQSDESQRLSEELSRIRDLREQLAALDRQLAELRDRENDPSAEPDGRGGQGDQPPPWREARELLDELQREDGLEIESPVADGFNPGRSAPGTEAWKQDFAAWDVLKVQVAAALECAERSAAARLRDQPSTDRLHAGATQRVPEQYRRLVEQYFRALASGAR
ncbi:MAG: hypothetical protein HY657_17365 [Acidobacteria bacterium]|nr:hypothetical protein [Acidobacteriota bacterium]